MMAEDLDNDNIIDSFINDEPPLKGSDGVFKIINTNASSLCPKINSLVDCFEETGASIGVVTETWLSDGDSLQEDLDNLLHGTGVGMLCRNRDRNNLGFSHGGWP